MALPFTIEQFLAIFEAYNLAIWPVQIVAYVLGLMAIALVVRGGANSGSLVSGILALLWLWTGLAYHLWFFAEINPVARVFALVFIVQAGVFVYAGIVQPELRFRAQASAPGLLGTLFIVYALVLYPLMGALLGHAYPRSPTFGVTPCPLTIFTLGMLLWVERPVPRYVLGIPLLWSLVGSSAAVSLGILEDTGLLVAAVGVLFCWFRGTTRRPRPGVAAQVGPPVPLDR